MSKNNTNLRFEKIKEMLDKFENLSAKKREAFLSRWRSVTDQEADIEIKDILSSFLKMFIEIDKEKAEQEK